MTARLNGGRRRSQKQVHLLTLPSNGQASQALQDLTQFQLASRR